MPLHIQNAGVDPARCGELPNAGDVFAPASPLRQQVEAALARGESLAEAVRTIGASPKLPPAAATPDPKTLERCLTSLPPSTIGAVFALITDIANKQRQADAEQRFATTESVIAELHNQAEEMHSKAVTQIVLGVVSGALSIGMGVASAAVSWKGMGKANRLMEEGLVDGVEPGVANSATVASQNAMMATNIRAGLLNQVAGGLSTALGGITQGAVGMYDETIKRMDAEVERRRAVNEALTNVEEALKQLIQKALQTADAIQQSTNQARQKILG